MLQQARGLSHTSTVAKVPKCSRCPGLLGVFREEVSLRNGLRRRRSGSPSACVHLEQRQGVRGPDRAERCRTHEPDQPTHDFEALESAHYAQAHAHAHAYAAALSCPDRAPTEAPTEAPTSPSLQPTQQPTLRHTAHPTSTPSEAPSEAPSTATAGSSRGLSQHGEQDEHSFLADVYRDTDTELRRHLEAGAA